MSFCNCSRCPFCARRQCRRLRQRFRQRSMRCRRWGGSQRFGRPKSAVTFWVPLQIKSPQNRAVSLWFSFASLAANMGWIEIALFGPLEQPPPPTPSGRLGLCAARCLGFRRWSQVIAICIDRSGSMGTPFAEVTLNVVRGIPRSAHVGFGSGSRVREPSWRVFLKGRARNPAGGAGKMMSMPWCLDLRFRVGLGLEWNLNQVQIQP